MYMKHGGIILCVSPLYRATQETYNYFNTKTLSHLIISKELEGRAFFIEVRVSNLVFTSSQPLRLSQGGRNKKIIVMTVMIEVGWEEGRTRMAGTGRGGGGGEARQKRYLNKKRILPNKS